MRTGNPPAVIDGKSWAGGPIRCTNASHCIVPGVSSNKLYVTNAGIASVASDFQTIVPDPKVGWFQGPFVAVGPRNGESSAQSVVISGLGLCNSTDGGYPASPAGRRSTRPSTAESPCRWRSCSPATRRSVTARGEPHNHCWRLHSPKSASNNRADRLVCGGEISEPMSGWVHTTADGGGKSRDHHWHLSIARRKLSNDSRQ